jgi:hypothetical protein
VNRLDPTQPLIHTISPIDTSPFPSSVLEVNYLDATNLSLYLEGVSADSLTITGGEADILMGTANIMGAKAVKNTGALSTITASTVLPYKFTQNPVFTYFGSTIARLQDWTGTINNNGKLKFYHGTAAPFPFEYIHGAATYTLETTVIPTDTTFFDVLKNAGGQSQGALSCTILYTRGTNDTMQLAFTNCWLKKAPHSIPEEAEVPVKLTIEPRNLVATVTQTPLSTVYAVWV